MLAAALVAVQVGGAGAQPQPQRVKACVLHARSAELCAAFEGSMDRQGSKSGGGHACPGVGRRAVCARLGGSVQRRRCLKATHKTSCLPVVVTSSRVAPVGGCGGASMPCSLLWHITTAPRFRGR